MTSRTPSRRAILAGFASVAGFASTAGLASMLAAPKIARAGAAGASGAVTLMGFYGVFEDTYRKAVLAPFMQKFPAIQVTFRPVRGSIEATALLRTQHARPTVDAVIMDLAVAAQNNRDGLFAPLDPAVVTNLADIEPWGRPAGNLGAALTQDVLVLLYAAKNVTRAPSSWNDLADPAFAGRIGLPIADMRGLVLTVLLDRMLGADYRQNVDPAIAMLKRIARNVQTYEPQPEPYTAIRSGLIDLGIGWNARGQLNADQAHGDFAAIVPVEGTGPQINTINLVANAPNAAAAQVLINYALGREAQEALTQALYYGPTNRQVQLAPALATRIFGTAETRSRQMTLDWDWFSRNSNALIQRIRREVIAG